MSLIKRVKSHFLIKDTIHYLHLLANEARKGEATEVDLEYWDVRLNELKEHVDNLNGKHRETLELYNSFKNIVKNALNNKKIENEPLYVISSLRGLWDTLENHLQSNEYKKGDKIVVLGDWMAFEGDKKSIDKAIELSGKYDILFLRGETEESFMKNNAEDMKRCFFIENTPINIETERMFITTGTHPKDTINKDIFNQVKDKKDMKLKYHVSAQGELNDDANIDEKERIIEVLPGSAIRLELKDKK